MIGAMTALVGAATARVRPEAVSGAVNLPGLEEFERTGINASAPSVSDVPWVDSMYGRTDKVRERLRITAREFDSSISIPARIANKRSWSPVVKETMARNQHAQLWQLLNRLENESTWEQTLRYLQEIDPTLR
jgi:hypothetical protein